MIVGIDLGTTNSLVAAWIDGAARLIPNALGSVLTPSCVSRDEDGTILVGSSARERLVSHPAQTAAAFKRYMGSSRVSALGKRDYRPEELSALVLRALKADAEQALGVTVTEAVITVPAYFSDAQRKATKIAGGLAGLDVERLLNEPTAAALAYGVHEAEGDRKLIVLDLGGGTFDVSVLEHFEGVMEVRATAGDNFLGGEDFVDALVEGFVAQAPPKLRGISGKPELYAQLRRRAELLKRQLTDSDSATLELVVDGESISWTVSREEFEALTAKLLQRLRRPIERALRDARIRPEQLDEVILAGGATRMPMVRKMAAVLFGRLPAQHQNPDEIVARGAAVQAGLKARDVALREVVLTDVCPYTLGIETSEILNTQRNDVRAGFYLPIIERNTVIPASRVQTVVTVADHQSKMHITIFQGESRLVKDNIRLGELSIPIPRRPKGEAAVDVRFTYDVDGLLEVDIASVDTGERRTIVIEGNPGVLSDDEVKRRLGALEQLKIHPRDQLKTRSVVALAERIYEESLGEQREYLTAKLREFEAVLERQDPREVEHACQTLAAFLETIDRDFRL